MRTSQLSLFHSDHETQGFWSILKVSLSYGPSNLTVKRVSSTQNVKAFLPYYIGHMTKLYSTILHDSTMQLDIGHMIKLYSTILHDSTMQLDYDA